MSELVPYTNPAELATYLADLRDTVETIPQVRREMARGEAMKAISREVGITHAGRNVLAAHTLNLQRMGGQMLQTMDPAPGGRPPVNQGDDGPGLPTLAELLDTSPNRARHRSKRWKALANIAEDTFTAYVDSVLEDDSEEVTTAGLLQYHAAQRTPAEVTEPIPPEPGTYRCIVLDPPWPMQKIVRHARPLQGVALDYPTLSLEQIADETHVPVRTHAADDCHIYLWVTHRFLPAGLSLLNAWGFEYQCVMTWRKNVGITPFSWMYDTEHVLFGTLGNLPLQQLGMRLSFEALVTGHSVKPDVFYERVLAASPGPRIEMFARQPREGFEAWGNEVADVRP